jgi:signal transduction histidine kinase/serine phosphatase RsbU (regulator of sigma subunit)/DNA-binding response OmpR family regulator
VSSSAVPGPSPSVAAEMDRVDWRATPLGPPETWPDSLRSTVQMLLASRFSMWMGWGEELTFFYNDAYAHDTLAAKHPWALGRAAHEVWAEIWDDIGPRIEQVLSTRTATWDEALLLYLERAGYREETYHTFSYSPLTDESGATAGMLCVVVEETERVLGERRLRTLRDLATGLAGAESEAAVYAAVERRLAESPLDLPFTLTYVFDADGGAHLRCRTGTIPAGVPATEHLEAAAMAKAWPAGRVDLPASDEPGAPDTAVVLELSEAGRARPAGVLVAGVTPFRELDTPYLGFLDLVAGQIASSIADVRARESERRRAEALAELDRAKTAFFQNVSHEFRTPLSLIIGPAEDAMAQADDPQQRERIDVVLRNARRLQKLVNNLLDFSRLESGRAEPERELTDLAAFTADLASMFRSATERAGIELVVERPDSSVAAAVDREMWERIVLNLLSNAFKFTFEGEIRVTVVREGDDAVLTVADTGTGIEPAELERLFERFRRVRGARSRTHEGSGIGLALVQELVELHEGTVSMTSAVGVGSTCTVRLPLAAEVPEPGTHAAPTTVAAAYVEEALRWLPGAGEVAAQEDVVTPRAVATDVPRARVLIADDNADLREYLTRLLSRIWEVEAVGDGRAALAAVAARPPDLILSDAMMPELDGFGLLAALRADPATAQLPVIMLSARAGEASAVEGLGAGADDYLIKPFSSRELIARVRANLDLAELRRAAALATERHSQLLRDLADAAIAINRARTAGEVLEVTARRARDLVGAAWALARLSSGGGERSAEAGDVPADEGQGALRVPLSALEARGELVLAGEAETRGVEAEAMLTQLAQVASTRLENALLYEREHRVAETLQRSLLPPSLPELATGELAALYLPGSDEASVGGDWYDAFAIGEHTIALVIGDVVGRGVHAASTMGQLRNAVRAYVHEGYTPAQTLARVDRLLHAIGGGFATLFCALADLRDGSVRYASAGHPPPLVVAADGSTGWLAGGLAPPIGAARNLTFHDAETEVPGGAALVLYTDGLVERRGESIDAGLERLAAAATSSPGHAPTLAARLVREMPEADRPDDVAVLVFARHGVATEPAVVRLPAEPGSLAALRDRLRRWMGDSGVAPGPAQDLLLAVGEAAANAVEHPLEPAPAAIVVTAERDGRDVVVVVRDHGRWQAAPSDQHRGRGLGIMRALASDVDVRRTDAGTFVTIRSQLGDPR